MGLEIKKLKPETQTQSYVTATQRLYLTSDGELVEEGNRRARVLLCTPGKRIPLDVARRHGLIAGSGEATPEGGEKIEAAPDEKVEASAAPDAEKVEASSSTKRDTVAEILERVGDDAAVAAAELEHERGHAKKPRATLVEALEAVIADSGDTVPDAAPEGGETPLAPPEA